MGILKKAVNEQSFLKCGIYGEAGSGKTTTASYLAMAISHQLGNKKPVAFYETEAGSDFLVKRFEMEGIELLRVKSHSLNDLVEAGEEAEKTCSILLVDSISHVWAELLDAKLRAINNFRKSKDWEPVDKLEFQHYNDIKREWKRWTNFFLNSQLHVVVCGRAADIWEFAINEKGKRELQKGGTKMRAEKEFGYEPSLSIEMERVMRGNKAGAGWKHRATILKDRSDTINGKAFDFEKPKAMYKKGDWTGVYRSLEPAIVSLNLGATHKTIDPQRNSEDVFSGSEGQGLGASKAKMKDIAVEEIDGMLSALWAGQTANEKKMRGEVVFRLFQTRSKTAVESKSLEDLQLGVKILREFEGLVREAQPESEEAVMELLSNAIKIVAEKPVANGADKNDDLPANFGASLV